MLITIVGDVQMLSGQSPTALLQSERIVSLHVFESWESRLSFIFDAAKKRLICPVQTLKHILQNLRADLLKFWKYFFDFRQLLYLIVTRNLAAIFPHHAPVFKCAIVKKSAKRKRCEPCRPIVSIETSTQLQDPGVRVPGLNHLDEDKQWKEIGCADD